MSINSRKCIFINWFCKILNQRGTSIEGQNDSALKTILPCQLRPFRTSSVNLIGILFIRIKFNHFLTFYLQTLNFLQKVSIAKGSNQLYHETILYELQILYIFRILNSFPLILEYFVWNALGAVSCNSILFDLCRSKSLQKKRSYSQPYPSNLYYE